MPESDPFSLDNPTLRAEDFTAAQREKESRQKEEEARKIFRAAPPPPPTREEAARAFFRAVDPKIPLEDQIPRPLPPDPAAERRDRLRQTDPGFPSEEELRNTFFTALFEKHARSSKPPSEQAVRDLEAMEFAEFSGLDPQYVKDNLDAMWPSWLLAKRDPVEWQRQNPLKAELVFRNPHLFDVVVDDEGLNTLFQSLVHLWDSAVVGTTAFVTGTLGHGLAALGTAASILGEIAPVARQAIPASRALGADLNQGFIGASESVTDAMDWVRDGLLSRDARIAFQNAGIRGKWNEPDTWDFEGLSWQGYTLMLTNVVGEMAPVLLAAWAGGPFAAAAFAGVQGAGGAAMDARSKIEEWYIDGTLPEKVPYYRDQLAAGATPEEALERTKQAASAFSAPPAGLLAGIGGGITARILNPRLFRLFGVNEATSRIIAGALSEPATEVLEAYAGQAGRNIGVGAPVGTDLGEDTLADVVLSTPLGVGEGVSGSIRAVVHRAQLASHQAVLEGLIEARLSGTAQAAAKEVAAFIAERGGPQEVYAQADEVIRNIREQGKTPEAVLGPELAAQVERAAQDGDKVAIPVEFLLKQQDPGTTLHIIQNSSINPDEPTLAEMQANEKEILAETQRILAEDEKLGTPDAEATVVSEYEKNFIEHATKVLQERGFARSDARHMLATWRAEIRTAAKREGLPPEALFKGMNARFRNITREEAATMEGQPQQKEETPTVVRGYTRRLGDFLEILLTPDANHSTVIHESAHAFLERAVSIVESAEGTPLQQALRTHESRISQHRHRETLVLLSDSGSVLLEAEGEPETVGVSKSMVKALRRAHGKITGTHNHPGTSKIKTLSPQDVALAAEYGFSEFRATETDGTVFWVRFREDSANLKEMTEAEEEGVFDLFSNVFTKAFEDGEAGGDAGVAAKYVEAAKMLEERGYFLEFGQELPSDKKQASSQLRQDIDTLLKWAGYGSIEGMRAMQREAAAGGRDPNTPPPIPTREERVERALQAAEEQIRGNDYETLVLFSENGERIHESKGDEASVGLPMDVVMKIRASKNARGTHNHPTASGKVLPRCVSPADVAAAVVQGLAEMRAVDSDGFVSWIRRTSDTWGDNLKENPSGGEILAEYKRIAGIFSAAFNEGVKQAKKRFSIEKEGIEDGKKQEKWTEILLEEVGKEYRAAAEANGINVEFGNQVRRQHTQGGDGTADLHGGRTREELNAPHEKIARLFEAYAMEGKAPSRELRPAFARYRVWLTHIYGDVKNLGVEVTPEVRDVLDRLLATEEQIADAMLSSGDFFSFFKTPEEMGVTPEEFERLKNLQIKATSKAALTAHRKMLEDRLKATEENWKRLLNEKVKKFREEYKKLPERRAQRFLLGWIYDEETGTESKALSPVYLDRAAVEEALGGNTRGLRLKKDGVDPDGLADVFGFATGKEMLEAVVSLKDEKTWAKERAEAEMIQENPGLLEDQERMREQIAESLHNVDMAKFLIEMLNALDKMESAGDGTSRRVRKPSVYRAALTAAAEERVAKEKAKGLNPNHALRAEQAAGREALKAALRKNPARAAAFVERQLLQHARYKALLDAKKRIESFLKLAKTLSKDSVRAEIGKGSDENVLIRQGIDTILAGLKLREPQPHDTLIDMDDLEALSDLAKSVGAKLDTSLLTKIILGQKPWEEITVEEMESVHGALKVLRALSSTVNRTRVGADWMDANEAAQAFIQELKENKPDTVRIDGSGTFFSGMKNLLRRGEGGLLKPETVAEIMGGTANTESMAFRILIEPIMRAHYEEAARLDMWTKPVYEALQKVPKKVRQHGRRRIDGATLFPNANDLFVPPKTVSELLVLALNIGNNGNVSRLESGWGITKDEVIAALAQTLGEDGKATMRWIQSVWDAADGMWPEARKIEERVSGIAPKNVYATPVETPWGTFRGGYFPLRYRYESEVRSYGDRPSDFLSREFIPPGTPHGFVHDRAQEHSGVLDLSVDGIHRGLRHVAHDIAYRETILSLARFLQRKDVSDAIIRHMGRNTYDDILQWVKDVGRMQVVGEGNHAEVWNRLARFAKRTVVDSVLKYRIPVAAADLPNMLLPVIGGEITMGELTRGIREAADIKRAKEMHAKLGSLRDLRTGAAEEYEREVARLGRHRLTSGGPLADFLDYGYHVYEYATMGFATPVAIAAYEHALTDGKTEEQAVAYANHVVRKTFASKSIVNAAPILRDKGFMGTALSFHGFLVGVAFQRARLIMEPLRSEKTFAGKIQTAPRVAAQMVAFILVYQHFAEIIMGRGPEEEEKWGEWFIRKGALAVPSMIPVVSDLAGSVESLLSGKRPSVRGSPLAEATNRVMRAISKAKSADEIEDALKAYYEIIGTITGLPQYPVTHPGSHVLDVLQGDADPDPLQFIYGPEPAPRRTF